MVRTKQNYIISILLTIYPDKLLSEPVLNTGFSNSYASDITM